MTDKPATGSIDIDFNKRFFTIAAIPAAALTISVNALFYSFSAPWLLPYPLTKSLVVSGAVLILIAIFSLKCTKINRTSAKRYWTLAGLYAMSTIPLATGVAFMLSAIISPFSTIVAIYAILMSCILSATSFAALRDINNCRVSQNV